MDYKVLVAKCVFVCLLLALYSPVTATRNKECSEEEKNGQTYNDYKAAALI